MKYWILIFTMTFPLFAHARVTCEDYNQIMSVDDDPCESFSVSAKRCFSDLNSELDYLLRSKKDKAALSDLKQDYEREIGNWNNYYAQMTNLGEGRACYVDSGKVSVWIEQMEKDLKVLSSPKRLKKKDLK